MLRYKSNDQIREYLLSLMESENMTYKKLGEKMKTSPQNVHKMIHKDQLKLDDISKICSALDYNFYFDIGKDNNEYSEIKTKKVIQSLQKIQNELDSITKVQKEMENQVGNLLNQIDDKQKKSLK